MPAPDIFDDEIINSLNYPQYLETSPYNGMLYMTDRQPADENDDKNFYQNVRSGRIRVGVGEITYSGKKIRSSELRKISLAKTGTDKYPLKVTSVEEYGVLANVQPYGSFHDPSELDGVSIADQTFADLINQKLSASKQKDIFIYVHGYKVVFENPLLVSTELWHFMGYDGVFISYAWPSTPKRLAYFKDIETAHLSGHNLRLVLEYLAENTNADQIHIIGFSSGTRVVITALHEMALTRQVSDKQSIQKEFRIGQVTLMGSDYDKHRFAAAISDGLLKVSKVMTIYMSATDGALGMSHFIFRRSRLGEIVKEEKAAPAARTWINKSDEIYFIDVTDAEKSNTGNGHAYFRKSPWASSDLLMTLKYGLTPAERGLVLKDGEVVWSFPIDYIARLRSAVLDVNSK